MGYAPRFAKQPIVLKSNMDDEFRVVDEKIDSHVTEIQLFKADGSPPRHRPHLAARRTFPVGASQRQGRRRGKFRKGDGGDQCGDGAAACTVVRRRSFYLPPISTSGMLRPSAAERRA